MANTARLYNLLLEVRFFAKLNNASLSAIALNLPPRHEITNEQILVDAIKIAIEELNALGGTATNLRLKLIEWLDAEYPSP